MISRVMTDPIEKLSALFLKFPGIGRRQAKRFVYSLLAKDAAYIKELTESIAAIRKDVSECPSCHRFFTIRSGRKNPLCDICASEQTDHGTIMVVEKDVDLDNIQKSGAYHGTYFVLGGNLPIADKNPHESIRTKSLIERVSSDIKNKTLKEIILALSATTEGEHTAAHVKKILEPLTGKAGVTVTVLGRGLSTGTELEYSDADTLQNALKNRG